MPFMCVCEREKEVAIVRCAGSILVGDDTDYFHRAINEAAVGASGIVVDLEKVTYLDSSGLGSLIRAHNIQSVQHRPVVFLKPSKRVLDLITMTGVDRVLVLRDEREAAMALAAGLEAPVAQPRTSGTPILCVEPQPEMQACLTALLEGAGCKVSAVRSGYDARMLGSGVGAVVVLGPGLSEEAKAAAQAALPKAKRFVSVAKEFAEAQTEEEMKRVVSEVVSG